MKLTKESLAVSKSRDKLRKSRFQPPFLCRFNVGYTWYIRKEEGEGGGGGGSTCSHKSRFGTDSTSVYEKEDHLRF